MKRLVFWSILAVFSASVAGWTLYAPRRPERLLRAVAPQASLVGIFHHANRALPVYLQNPLVASLVESAGFDVDDFKEWLSEPSNAGLFDWLFSDETTLAYVPAGLLGPHEIWMITSCLNGRQTLLARFLMGTIGVEGITPWTVYRSRPVYRVDLNEPEGAPQLVFFLVEGGIIGCYSGNPRAIHHMIDFYDRQRGGIASDYLRLASDDFCREAPFHGWLDMAGARHEFMIATLTSNRVHAFSRTSLPVPRTAIPDAPAPDPAASRLLGPLPQGLLLAHPALLAEQAGTFLPNKYLTLLDFINRLFPVRSVFAALLGDDYGGRVMGMKMPALLVGLALGDTTDLPPKISDLIDRINATFRLGLVPASTVVGERGLVYVLEGTADQPYADTPFHDRFAYTIAGSNLLVCSSADALMKLVARAERPESDAAGTPLPWQSLAAAPGAARLWYDLRAGGKSIRLALAARALQLAQEHPEDSSSALHMIQNAKAWSDALAPLEHLAFKLTLERERMLMEVELGP